MTNDLFSPAPYVAGSDTSRERAQSEDSDGTTTARRIYILERLRGAGPMGMTWRELSAATGLHHGQVSGCLSVLHKSGNAFQVVAKRDKCHPYVHAQWIMEYDLDEVIVEPAQTLAGKRNAAMQSVVDAARAFCDRGLGLQAVVEALAALDELDA